MKIISYNVNGLRAAIEKGFASWLADELPDVLCLQETKLQEEQFPRELFSDLGYSSYLFCATRKRGYSGVAILCRQEPDSLAEGMGMPDYDAEGRFLRADFGDLSVVSVYHPSGTSGEERQSFKMQWLADFRGYVTELRKSRPKLILCGDYNISHEPIDIHDPIRNAKNSGFLPEEREWMTGFLDSGFTDSFRYKNPTLRQYSWWSYRSFARRNDKGWRLDYCMVSNEAHDRIEDAYILGNVVHSDHCPVALVIRG
ncbi:MAG: exodeoxyribonuclease III [Tannerellaceae bacterium]|nr:exodeoxyribonuclease III [Tannerellaceae bacterium]